MGLMSEYIKKKLSASDLEDELMGLISKYNKLQHTYLFVFVTCMNKRIPILALEQSDFYMIRDMLSENSKNNKKLDMYIETPGGSGETAEEIVRYLRKNFDYVSFVVSGEAKSAGTIIVLSGNEIIMTETGSLGPIDAQIKIGRSLTSAYDYVEWVNEKRKEAEKEKRLNPFDATMIAQITPGELGSVIHSLNFAKDLVVEWLVKYKFKDWNTTKTRKVPVTDTMKKKRALEIASELINHSKWRSHGRSIKAEDLEDIGLDIQRLDNEDELSDIVYRIQTVCRLLFETSTIYKIFATEDSKIFRQATVANIKPPTQIQQPDVIEFSQKCPKCGKEHKIYGKFVNDKRIDADMKNIGKKPFPKGGKLKCECGFEINLTGIRNQIEVQTGKKMLYNTSVL